MADTKSNLREIAAKVIRERISKLTPEEQKKLGKAVTPELAAIFAKIFGPEAADIMDKAGQLTKGTYGKAKDDEKRPKPQYAEAERRANLIAKG